MQANVEFDPDDLSFRAWLAAYLATVKELADADLPGVVNKVIGTWCEVRLGARDIASPGAAATVLTWVRGPLRAWDLAFWSIYGAGGTLAAALDLIAGGAVTPEETRLLARARTMDIAPADRAVVMLKVATIKQLHVKNPAASLHPAETTWAPTGTYTGGGAQSIGGKGMMPFNVMVSRALTSPRDVLHAVLFELENIKRWRLMEGKRLADLAGYSGRAGDRASIEFDAFAGNQESLRIAYGAVDQRALCVALGVPAELLVGVPTGQQVPTPTHAVLRDKPARNALWWFQTQDWPADVRRDVFVNGAHGGGMASSKDLYKTK